MKFNYKKSLGQNFLKDQNIINKIVESINPSSNDLIIEIGPGAGSLTKELVKKDCDVICFEIDTRLKEVLDNIDCNNLTVIYSDFLKVNIYEFIKKKYDKLFFVGNLPYYITTAIINKIAEETDPYEITIMIQKEVAERFMAKPYSREYGSLSVFLQYNFDIEKICTVSKNCFEPIPKVDSMVIKLKRKDNNFVKDKEFFYKLIKDAFKQKRKNLRNNLKSYNLEKMEIILNGINKNLTNRAEELSVEDFINISNKYID